MKHPCFFMVRFLGVAGLGLGRFRPSVHLCPPLVLLSCLVASTAAPAVNNDGHDALAQLQELRELLVPGFGQAPEVLIGVGGITLGNPVTGTVVPAFQLGSGPTSGEGAIIDGFVVPSGYFLARSGGAPGGSGFRLTTPFAFRWTGTASTPPLQLTWQAGTLFDNVFDGATGSFVPFRIVPAPASPETGEGPSSEPLLALPAEPAEETPGQGVGDDVFDTALLPPVPEPPSGEQPGPGPGDQPGDGGTGPGGQGPAGEAPDPASVPGPLPVAGVAIAWRCSRRLRRRLRQAG